MSPTELRSEIILLRNKLTACIARLHHLSMYPDCSERVAQDKRMLMDRIEEIRKELKPLEQRQATIMYHEEEDDT